MNTFTHIHSSSRYNRSPASAAAAAKNYFKKADLVTWTEIEWNTRATAIRNAGKPNFGLVNGNESDQNDCGISFNKKRFKLIYFENYKSGKVPFYLGRKKLDVQYITIAVLEDLLNGKRMAVGVIHLASGVEGDLARKINTRATLNWYASFKASRTRLNKIAKKYNCVASMYVADFNINFKKPWAKALVETITPRYLNTWRNVKVKGGTHGGRIIDATLLKGKLGVKGSATLYKDDDSSDHRPYQETLSWLA